MSLIGVIWTGMVWFFNLFLGWLMIFASPFSNVNMLWIIIPIYINWIFTDFFQERRRTSFGNAITNGAVTLWVSIDWARTLVSSFKGFNLLVYFKFGLVALVLVYGMFIIVEGIRGKDFVTRFGRVRETSYIMLMFTPVVYGVLELKLLNILAMVIFFPIFYFLIELINHKLLPKLGLIKHEEEEEKKLEKKVEEKEEVMPGLGSWATSTTGMPEKPNLGKEFKGF